jgi:hypothetical protein
MPTIFSLSSMVIHTLIGLGINYIFRELTGDTEFVGLTAYFAILAHGKFVLLEKIYNFSTMLKDIGKPGTLNKENDDEKFG